MMYFLMAKVESDFIYKVFSDVNAFALDSQFVHRVLFADGRFKNKYEYLLSSSWTWYRTNVYSKCQSARKGYLALM